ncbi:hypothetical protein H9639_06985 [Arthrobacter sp. Sa2CUA1]|uniref:Uncharacterized protein n=1 Tax=Arthrobacter gallicola TaxID=2762225 RepID=A0ABR8UR43_9MICC|nr:hypothetical protein [Arthrobacter gallicola]MBD7995037.1 hypothetical protein [Arthrobacter gallicola]
MSSCPNDEEAIRCLLAESGVEATQELEETLRRIRESGREPAPAPCAELEALFSPGVTPLRKSTRRRGFLLGGAVVAAMAAGTTGVAATSQDFWITAEASYEPAPFTYEEVPAPTPEPPLESAAVPAADPAAAADPAPSADPAGTPAPVKPTEPVPAPAAEDSSAPALEAPAPAADEAQPVPGGNRSWPGSGRGQGGGPAERAQWRNSGGWADGESHSQPHSQPNSEKSGSWPGQYPGRGAEGAAGPGYAWQTAGGGWNHGGSGWGPGSR